MMLHGWGSGDTAIEAIKNMKSAMGVSRLPAQYFVKEFSAPCDPYVDQMGTINWWDDSDAITVKTIQMKIRGKALVLGDEANVQFEQMMNN